MTDLERIKGNLEAISAFRQIIARQEEILRADKQTLANLRDETLALLQSNDLKSMKSSTIAVSITHKRDVKIVNPEGVKAWLRNQFKDQADQYLSVDALRTKPLLKTALWEDGEEVDGAIRTEADTLTLKDIKTEETE